MTSDSKGRMIPSSDPDWMEALEGVRHDYFHLPSWATLDSDWRGGTAYLASCDSPECNYLCPLSISTVRGYVHAMSPYGSAGPLVPGGKLLNHARIECLRTCLRDAGVDTALLRLHPLLTKVQPLSSDDYLSVCHGPTMWLDLQATAANECVSSLFHSSTRRDIRRGHREGLYAETAKPSTADIQRFHALYERQMESKSAAQYLRYDSDYLDRLAFLREDETWISQVFVGSDLVSANIFVSNGALATYHLSATDYEFELAGYASKVAISGGIDEALRRGCQMVSFGGGLGGSFDSLAKFKSRFANLQLDFHTLRILVQDRSTLEATHNKGREIDLSAHFPPTTED